MKALALCREKTKNILKEITTSQSKTSVIKVLDSINGDIVKADVVIVCGNIMGGVNANNVIMLGGNVSFGDVKCTNMIRTLKTENI